MIDNRYMSVWRSGFWSVVLWFCLCGVSACSGDEPPAPPRPEVEEATEIERNSAKLTGVVTGTEHAAVGNACFRYGLTDAMELSVAAVQATEGRWEAVVSGLTAGSTYTYCLEISNGKSTLRSSTLRFQTLPNAVPAIGEIELVNKGPLSATVKCTIEDAGGEAFTRIGFLLQKEGDSEETFIAATAVEEAAFVAQLGGLEMGTDYTVKACAANSLGERQSEALAFQTNSAIQVGEAGTLARIVGEEWKFRLQSITIAGSLNGTDIRFLREMLGWSFDGLPTEGVLEEVNLTDCRMVAGGEAYVSSRYTADDTLGSDMFAGCTQLKQITLPQGLLSIEEDAFRGCMALERLVIPEQLTTMNYSSGCTGLTTYEVSPLNRNFYAADGVLYSYDRTSLVLYPMGKADDAFRLPEQVEQIGKNAFRESLLPSLTLPDRVKTIGEYAFAASALTTARIGNGVMSLPKGIFQGCRMLTTVTLGEDVRRIGDYAFSGCTALSNLTLLATYPPTCGEGVFDATLYADCTLSVPSGCRAIYRSSSTWNGFSRLVETGN